MHGVRTVMIAMEICEEAANILLVKFCYKHLLTQSSLVQGVYYELKIILSMDYMQHSKLLALAIPYSSSPMGTVDMIN